MRHRHGVSPSFDLSVACAMAFLILLSSSPLHSNTFPTNLPSISFAQGGFVAVDEFSKAFGMTTTHTPANHKLTLGGSGRSVVFTRQSSVFRIGQEVYRMPHVLLTHKGQFYIPQQTAALIARYLNVSVSFQTVDTFVSAESPPVPAVTPPPMPDQPRTDVADNAANWKLHTVVIDPGHGGKDPGAIGQNGTHEKTIVLEVAKRLKSLLEKQLKVKVILTRDDDTFVPLGKRSKLAIQKQGKVFVSLHCNATKNRQATGVEVYFLSEAKTRDAALVAQNENAVMEKFEGVSADSLSKEVDRIRYRLLSSQFLIESQDLAADLHDALVAHIPKTMPRGVKQANFYVMRGTMGQMPSVLVELGFVTNRAEEKQLRSKTRQKKLAEALYQGIRIFKQRYEQQLSTDRS